MEALVWSWLMCLQRRGYPSLPRPALRAQALTLSMVNTWSSVHFQIENASQTEGQEVRDHCSKGCWYNHYRYSLSTPRSERESIPSFRSRTYCWWSIRRKQAAVIVLVGTSRMLRQARTSTPTSIPSNTEKIQHRSIWTVQYAVDSEQGHNKHSQSQEEGKST